jgi:excisionase family DNA binding protein
MSGGAIEIPITLQIPAFDFEAERYTEFQNLVCRLEDAAARIEKAFTDQTISWSEAEAAKLLGLEELTLARKRIANEISFSRVGRKARYTKRHLEEYLDNETQNARSKRKH